MRPIRTEKSSFVYTTLDPEIPNMPGERVQPGHVRSVWELTPWERDDVSQGGNIELNIYAEPIPPVSLNVTGEGATWGMPILFASRFEGDDGRWYVRISFRDGVRLTESKGYAHPWSAWLAQRRLKKILPALEVWTA